MPGFSATGSAPLATTRASANRGDRGPRAAPRTDVNDAPSLAILKSSRPSCPAIRDALRSAHCTSAPDSASPVSRLFQAEPASPAAGSRWRGGSDPCRRFFLFAGVIRCRLRRWGEREDLRLVAAEQVLRVPLGVAQKPLRVVEQLHQLEPGLLLALDAAALILNLGAQLLVLPALGLEQHLQPRHVAQIIGDPAALGLGRSWGVCWRRWERGGLDRGRAA